MWNIRLIAAGAMLIATAAVAGAQGQTDNPPGKPTSLLQPQTKTADKPHVRFNRHPLRTRAAKKERGDETADQPAETANAPAAANAAAASVWTGGDAAPLPGIATAATAPTVIPDIDQNLSELVVGGRTVQIATPDEANAIDLAADRQATMPADDAPAAPAVALAAPDPQGRDTWYEELLATLGGGLAAGLVAWLLIFGAGPQRMYG